MTNITAVKEEKKPGLSIKTQASAALAAANKNIGSDD